ncbi:hypothetical protein B0T22DRAFT_510947 [Podospora appendiculata]|uniref:Uncharacterized protein n=1 Tax=Podospora appendiculata TaxID=314037 RepID=A0AAE0X8A2_9PEZI|nr:hypothetical protein B0T22DRAFT_510947 [Podospora appendiculata]
MRPYYFPVVAFLATQSSGHGLITLIKGANGVEMPGLSVADGTPRNCNTRICGSHSDTAIIRDYEILAGRVGPLGRTRTNRTIDAAEQINIFMGKVPPPLPANFTNVAQACSTGPAIQSKLGSFRSVKRQTDIHSNINNFRSREARSAAAAADSAAAANGISDQCTCPAEVKANFTNARSVRSTGGIFNAVWRLFRRVGRGLVNTEAPIETIVNATAGSGAKLGLPACADDGTIELVYFQVNNDGAGPLDAHIDATSGGTLASAFRVA